MLLVDDLGSLALGLSVSGCRGRVFFCFKSKPGGLHACPTGLLPGDDSDGLSFDDLSTPARALAQQWSFKIRKRFDDMLAFLREKKDLYHFTLLFVMCSLFIC